MKEMGWSHDDLMDTPYERYLSIRRIMSIEQKEKKKEQKKKEREMKKEQSGYT